MASPPSPPKSAVREQILAALRAERDLQTQAALLARDEAISEESRAENKYDTHSQEAAYLAEGQARLAAEIAANIELYESLPLTDFSATDSVAVGALVALESRGKRSWYFLGPRAGGLELKMDDCEILVLTPQSPLGRELIGKRPGDTVRLPGRPAGAAVVAAVH